MTATATSRRIAMTGTIAAIVTSTVAAPAIAATSPDARLIALCDQIHAAEDDIDRLCETRLTIEDEERTDPQFIALLDRRDALIAKLELLGLPTSMAAIVAVARVALRLHPHTDAAGNRIAGDDGEWLLLTACEALTANV
ncbi:MAG: hypothetical protein ACJ8AW_31605 [Rhodopila sp.]